MMMLADISILWPPLALPIVFGAVVVFSFALSRLSLRAPGVAHAGEPYACGEDAGEHMIRPDYEQFLPFAFFFTILHVMALMATTVPAATPGSFVLAAVYMLCAVVGLMVIYSR